MAHEMYRKAQMGGTEGHTSPLTESLNEGDDGEMRGAVGLEGFATNMHETITTVKKGENGCRKLMYDSTAEIGISY